MSLGRHDLLDLSASLVRFGWGFWARSFWFEADVYLCGAWVAFSGRLCIPGRPPCLTPRNFSARCVLDFVFLWLPITESLRQALLKHVYGVNERVHTVGLERDYSPFNIPAQISHHLIEPAQTFRSQEGQYSFRVFLRVLRVNKFADAPSGKAHVVDGVTKLVQSNGVRCGFCFKPLLHVLQFGS
jgi:hypothetical protein